jgi:hypothetical protein
MADVTNELPEFFFHRYGYSWAFNHGSRSFDAVVRQARNWEVHAPATLVVGPDGQAWIVIRPGQPRPQLAQASIARPLVELAIESAGTPAISVPRLCIEQYNLRGSYGLLYERPTGGMVYVPQEPIQETFTALTMSDVTIAHEALNPDAEYVVRFVLVNAIFDGLEAIACPAAGSPRQVLGRMVFTVNGRQWVLDYLPAYEQRKQAISNKHATAMSTATLTTERVAGRDIDALDATVDAICWLMSIASGCAVADPIRQVVAADRLVQERFRPRMVSTNAHSNVNYELIANHAGGPSLKDFLEQTYAQFVNQSALLGLPQFIGWMLQASSQTVLESKTAIGVLALEAVATRWCMMPGPNALNEEQVIAMGLQQKLNRMRRNGMDFIETDFTEALREDIRNPLLHTGAIPVLTPREKAEWADRLYMLGFRILMKVLGFRGKHRDMAHDYRLVDAP